MSISAPWPTDRSHTLEASSPRAARPSTSTTCRLSVRVTRSWKAALDQILLSAACRRCKSGDNTMSASDPNPKAFLGVGWTFPPQLTNSGKVAEVAYEEDIRQAILIILGTNRGERLMRPDFG